MVSKKLTLTILCTAALGHFQLGTAQSVGSAARVTGPQTLANLLEPVPASSLEKAPLVPFSGSFERRSIPPVDELEAAVSLVQEACDELYRDNQGRPRFVVEQLWTFADQANDAARCYALLQEAERVARGSADVGLVVATALRQARSFEVDAYATLIESLKKLPIEQENLPELVGFFMAISRDALSEEEFAASREAQTQAMTAAQKLSRIENEEAKKLRRRSRGLARPPVPKGAGLIDQAQRLLEAIELQEKAFEQYQAGREFIGQSPSDGGANWNIGFYLCHFRRDWEEGLLFLAKGDRRGVRDTSQKELDAGQSPLPDEKKTIADMWWKLEADASLTSQERELAKSRATILYREVMPQLTDPLDRAIVARRLADAE